jgi:hypothetical protein
LFLGNTQFPPKTIVTEADVRKTLKNMWWFEISGDMITYDIGVRSPAQPGTAESPYKYIFSIAAFANETSP